MYVYTYMLVSDCLALCYILKINGNMFGSCLALIFGFCRVFFPWLFIECAERAGRFAFELLWSRELCTVVDHSAKHFHGVYI